MTVPELKRRWQQLFPEAAENQVFASFSRLQADYEDESRYYHNFQHIEDMLEAQERYFPNASRQQVLAVFFHDAVYDARRGDNEERSAALSQDFLQRLDEPSSSIVQVRRLIECTKDHIAATRKEQEVCDLDLLPLGIPATDYQANTGLIRKEYAFATDAEWSQGRIGFIDDFLGRPSIYITPEIRDQFEAAARSNLAHERTLLIKG